MQHFEPETEIIVKAGSIGVSVIKTVENNFQIKTIKFKTDTVATIKSFDEETDPVRGKNFIKIFDKQTNTSYVLSNLYNNNVLIKLEKDNE